MIVRSDLEVVASFDEGVKVAETDVRGGAMAAEGVEVTAADEDQLRDTEGRRATS